MLTYTIGVNNAGPNDASAVKVVDTLPAGTTFVSATGTNWTCTGTTTVTCNRTGGNLAPGAAPNITIVVTAPATPGSITNSATVSSPNDNTPGNNTASAVTSVGNAADLRVTKSGPASAKAGEYVVYSVPVENLGPSNNTAATLTDTLSGELQNATYCVGLACDPLAVGAPSWTGSLAWAGSTLVPRRW